MSDYNDSLITFDVNKNVTLTEIKINNEFVNQISFTFLVILGLTSVYGLLISTISLYYLLKKLKLNWYIKSLFVLMLSMNGLCSIFSLISQILFYLNGYFTRTSCQILIYSYDVLSATPLIIPLISTVKYYLSYLASKARIPKSEILIPILIISSALLYSFVVFFDTLYHWLGMPNYIDQCMFENSPDYKHETSLLIESIMSLIGVSIFFCGILMDVKLYKLVKLQHQKSSQVRNRTTFIPERS